MLNSFKICRIFNTTIYGNWTLSVLAALIFFNIFTSLDGRAVIPSVLAAAVTSILFIGSIAFHEMGHTLMARKLGMNINKIYLFIFGGAAIMEGEPKSGKQEFLMAIAGPVSSLALGFVFFILFSLLSPDVAGLSGPEMLVALSPASLVFGYLAIVNFMLGFFNMLPIYPMDGGRVFRGATWMITKNYRSSGKLAALVGQICAAIMVLAGVGMVFGLHVPFFGSGFGGLWIAMIFAFMWWQGNEYYRAMNNL